MLTSTPIPTPIPTSRTRSTNSGCCSEKPLPSTNTAVVAIATPSSRIHEIRAPASPTTIASANVQTLTPR